jgi:hypothetical protein
MAAEVEPSSLSICSARIPLLLALRRARICSAPIASLAFGARSGLAAGLAFAGVAFLGVAFEAAGGERRARKQETGRCHSEGQRKGWRGGL